jgi:hypothetical protein
MILEVPSLYGIYPKKRIEYMLGETKITDVDHRNMFGDFRFDNIHFTDHVLDNVSCSPSTLLPIKSLVFSFFNAHINRIKTIPTFFQLYELRFQFTKQCRTIPAELKCGTP